MNTNLIGKEIKIIAMPGDPQEADYIGRTGIVKSVDSAGQLHGTWGGLAIIPDHDTFEVLGEETARYTDDIWEAVDDPLNLDFEIDSTIVKEDFSKETMDEIFPQESIEESSTIIDESVFDKLVAKVKDTFKGKKTKEQEAAQAAELAKIKEYEDKFRKEVKAREAELMAEYEKEIEKRRAELATKDNKPAQEEPAKPIFLNKTVDSNGNEVKVNDTVKINVATSDWCQKFEGKNGKIVKIAKHPQDQEAEVIKVYFNNLRDYGMFCLDIGDDFEKVETNKMTMKLMNSSLDINKDTNANLDVLAEGIFDKKPPFKTAVARKGGTIEVDDLVYISSIKFNDKSKSAEGKTGKVTKVKGGLIYGTWGKEPIAPNKDTEGGDAVYKVAFGIGTPVKVFASNGTGIGVVKKIYAGGLSTEYLVDYYLPNDTGIGVDPAELKETERFEADDLEALSVEKFKAEFDKILSDNTELRKKQSAEAEKEREEKRKAPTKSKEPKELQNTKDSNGHNVTKGDTVKITKARNNVKKFEGQTGTITTIIDYPNVGDGIVVKFTSEKDKAGFAIKAGDKFEKVETNKMTMKVKPVQQKEKEEEEPATLHF